MAATEVSEFRIPGGVNVNFSRQGEFSPFGEHFQGADFFPFRVTGEKTGFK
jgi:hypothetical protein